MVSEIQALADLGAKAKTDHLFETCKMLKILEEAELRLNYVSIANTQVTVFKLDNPS